MARPPEPNSYRTLKNRMRELRNVITESKRNGDNVTIYETELNEIKTKLAQKVSEKFAESAQDVPFTEHNADDMDTTPDIIENETPEMGTESAKAEPVITEPLTESAITKEETNEMEPPKEKSLLEIMEEMKNKRAGDIKPDVAPPKEVVLEAPGEKENEYFAPKPPEPETVSTPEVTEIPATDTKSTVSDNIVELFLDNELLSDILIEGTETIFVEWYPTLYISSKFTKEEQRILMLLQFRMEKNKNKWMETVEEHEYEVLQKYLLLEEYKKKLPYSKSERDNLQKCVEKLLKNKAIKVSPETGLLITLGLAFSKRTFPIYDDKIADVISAGTDRLFTWLERITDKAEAKRNEENAATE